MIIFKSIRWQNFLSYGNTWTEIQLNSNKNTLIVGKNGVGKSTFLDAITFALYGKAFRNINKPQLINTITNRSLVVEIEFTIGKKEYKIVRGIKPNIFDIFVDDVLVKQDSFSKDYQEYLENAILKINYKSFCQIVVLGSGNYTPFMQLPAYGRRLIVEDLLDLSVFSTMNILLKEYVQSNKEDITANESDIKMLESNIAIINDHIKNIERDIKKEDKEYKNKIQTLRKEVMLLEKKLTKAADSISSEIKKLDTLKKYEFQHQLVIDSIEKLKKNIEKYKKQIDFYEKSCSCPTCKQNIDQQFKELTVQNAKKSIEKIDKNIELGNNKLEKLNIKVQERLSVAENLSSINLQFSELKTDKYAKETLINTYIQECAQLLQKFSDIDKSKKETLLTDCESAKVRKQELLEKRELLGVAGQLLKDGGIKTLIIKQYVPVMNKIINSYLAHMNFFIDFNLNENFEEVIKSRNRDDFSYASFSEGEKARINLAILFAWRAIAKMRNSSSTNLLIFDEIFDSSLDMDGTDDFMKILNSVSGDTNTFIISHKVDNISDKFEKIIKFEKVKNFSRMEIL